MAEVERLELLTHSRNIIKDGSITKVGELIQLTEEKLLKCRNSGVATVSDIRQALAKYGLTLLGSELFTGKTLHDLGVSSATEKALRRRGITSVDDLMTHTEKDLRKLPENHTDSDKKFITYGMDNLVNRLRVLNLSLPVSR